MADVTPIERARKRAKPAPTTPLADVLTLTKSGKPASTVANAVTILRLDRAWDGVIAHDERRGCPVFVTEPPFAPTYDGPETTLPRPIADVDASRIAVWAEDAHGASFSREAIDAAIEVVARRKPFDEVRSHLDQLVWDGEERLAKWLPIYLGAEDTPYVRAVGSAWLISAIARAYEPGAKADAALVLEGPQGIRKSTALEIIAGPAFFTDDIPDLRSKDAPLGLAGRWIVELAELDSLSRAEIATTKAFLSRRVDRFRAPYARRVEEHPRRCVFAGSTNEGTYLRDSTGGRRFWPVRCGGIDVVALRSDRDQILAEARERYADGVPWYLDAPDMIAAARDEQEARYVADAWEDRLADWLATRPAVQAPPAVTIGEALDGAVKLDAARWGQTEQNRIAKCFRRLGWVRKRDSGGERTWRYHPPHVPVSPSETEGGGT